MTLGSWELGIGSWELGGSDYRMCPGRVNLAVEEGDRAASQRATSVSPGSVRVLGATAVSPALGRGEDLQRVEGPAFATKVKITRLETFLVKPRWLFLKVHTNAGIVGLGEPVVEGRALTGATAVEEIEPYLVGKDPRRVVHHWQAIYRHAFYRGGPILTSALSGIDMALWDIKGKALGVPVYELLGGPTRSRVRVYAHARHAGRGQGAARRRASPPSRPGPPLNGRYARYVETPAAGRATRSSGSPSCARPPATTSTSASTSTARSARRWPSC